MPNQCEGMLEASLRENSDSLLFRGEVGVGIEGREKAKGTFTLLQISALTCQRNPLFIFTENFFSGFPVESLNQ